MGEKYLKVTFRNGNSIIFEPHDWDDWGYDTKVVWISRAGGWVALYNMKDVFAVEAMGVEGLQLTTPLSQSISEEELCDDGDF